MRHVRDVRVLDGYSLHLVFDDGVEGEVDLADLMGHGVFAAWKDESFFRKVSVGEHGELVWDDVVDLCPDSLYLRVSGQTASALLCLCAKTDPPSRTRLQDR